MGEVHILIINPFIPIIIKWAFCDTSSCSIPSKPFSFSQLFLVSDHRHKVWVINSINGDTKKSLKAQYSKDWIEK